MEKINFKLDNFEGPLDLLLYLLSKQKVSIHDVEISKLLDQYIQYIDQTTTSNINIKAEFLEMAARLVYIKTLALLPKQQEAEKLKDQLKDQLIEYSLCKIAAEKLKRKDKINSIFKRLTPDFIVNYKYSRIHSSDILKEKYIDIMDNGKKKLPVKSEVFVPLVKSKIISVSSKVIFILKKIYKSGPIYFDDVFSHPNKSHKIATFMALLELIKSNRIFLSSDNKYIFGNKD